MPLSQKELEQNVQAMLDQGATSGDVQEYMASQSKERKGFVSDAVGDIGEGISGVFEQFGQGGQQIVDTAQDPNLTLGEKARGIGSAAFQHGSRAIWEGVFGVAKAAVPESVERGVANQFEEIATRVAETDTARSVYQWYGGLNPDAKREVDNALGFAEGAVDLLTLGAGGKISKDVMTKLPKAAHEIVRKTTPEAMMKQFKKLDKATQTEVLDTFTDRLYRSFFEEDEAAKRALEKMARDISKQEKRSLDGQGLLRETLAEFHLFPEMGRRVFGIPVSGIASFDGALRWLDTKPGQLAEGIQSYLERETYRPKVSEIYQEALAVQKEIGRTGTADQIRSVIKSRMQSHANAYAKGNLGGRIKMTEANNMRIESNKASKARSGEQFDLDAEEAIAEAVRRVMDKHLSKGSLVREANREIGKMFRARQIIKQIDNKKPALNHFESGVGRYLGAIIAGTGIASGAGSLVIAGLLASLGGEVLSNFIRAKRFNPALLERLSTILRKDQILADKLIEEAKGADKAMLTRLLKGELLGEGAIPLGPEAKVSSVTAEAAAKGQPGQRPAGTPEGGQLFKTWKSVTQAQDDAAKAEAAQAIKQRIEDSIRGGEDINTIAKNLADKEGISVREAQDAVLEVANEVGPIPKAEGVIPKTIKETRVVQEKTDLSAIDDALFSKEIADYYREVKNKDVYLVKMSPDRYMKYLEDAGLQTKPAIDTRDKLRGIVEGGQELFAGYLSFENGKVVAQEGRNRALLAKEFGQKEIPVAIENLTFKESPERLGGVINLLDK